MRVLVTGATGCLGRNLCHHLRAHGYDVIGIGRNPAIGEALKNEGIDFQLCDLVHTTALDVLIKDCGAVVHCAALSSAWGRQDDFIQANITATENVLAASLRQGVPRFIHVSTSAVYFNYQDRFGILESDPVAKPMVNSYAASKFEAELRVQAANANGMETIIIRPRGIFGPYDQSLFPRILKAAKTGFFPLPDNGQAIIDITYVENVAYAIRLAIEAGHEASGRIYNVTNGEPRNIKFIFESLFCHTNIRVRLIAIPYFLLSGLSLTMERMNKIMNWEEPVLLPYTLGLLAKSQTLNINAAREMLGYHPKIGIEEGMDRFAHWRKKAI